jgi:tetratricopeptide (TPR) repeat protein
MWRVFPTRLIGFVALLCAAHAAVAADDPWPTCRAGRDLDEKIRACSDFITRGRPTRAQLTEAYYSRGSAYIRKNLTDSAIADFTKVIELNPKHALAFDGRAWAHNLKQNFAQAFRDASRAIELNPKYLYAYNNRGLALSGQGDHARAISDFSEAIRLFGNSPGSYSTPYTNRANSYRQIGALNQAIDDLSEVIRREPGQPWNYNERSSVYIEAGNFTAALSDLRRAHELTSDGTERLNLANKINALEHKLVAPGPSVVIKPPSSSSENSGAPVGGRRVALVIGNSAYRFASPLPNPKNDASDIAQTLRRLGFDVVEGRDLDRPGMDNVLRQFARKLDGADLALFFYAGHGLQVAGKNYLVPIDARLERPGDLALDTVDIAVVLAQMEADNRVNLVFLDACRDNPLSRTLAGSLGNRSISVGRGLAQIQSAIGTMIAYATQPDSVALDGDGRNSPFTAALLQHLPTPGLDISTVMRRVRTDVIAKTRQKQVPWDHSSLTGDVILAR